MLKIFVYGTLKPNEANFQRFCQPYVQDLQPALAEGKLYHLTRRGYPAMTLETGWVEGCLMIFADHRILQTLDELEDYQIGRSPELNEYQRQKRPIYSPSKTLLTEAWTYIMLPEAVTNLGGIPLQQSSWTGRNFPPIPVL